MMSVVVPGRRPYYGWTIAVTLGLTETTSWGILFYAFAVFLGPMEQELGWSRSTLSGAYSLALLVAGLMALPVGRWLDRHGARGLMTAGSCAGTVLVLAWSQVRHPSAYYVIWLVIGLTMATVLYDPAFAVIAVWFRRHRTRALTIVTLMAALASTIYLPLAGWLIRVQGWRAALVTLAVILGATTILPHALVLRRRPQDLGLEPDGGTSPGLVIGPGMAPDLAAGSAREAIRHPSFRWVALAFFLHALAATAVSVHLVPYLQDRGFDLAFAAAVTGIVGAMQIPGRLLFVPLGGWLSLRTTAALVILVQPISIAILLLTHDLIGTVSFVVLFGMSRGATTLLRPTLIAELYGAGRFGHMAGALALTTTVANALAPVGAAASYDLIGTYDPVFWLLSGIAVLAAGAMAHAIGKAG